MDVEPELLPVNELLTALHAEKIKFLIVGGTASVIHGVPTATLDVDIWVDLPARQYVRILAIAKKLAAEVMSKDVIVLKGDQRIDFLYRIDGLASFATEWKRSEEMNWAGQRVKVLPLDRVIRSKEAAGRPKDLIQLPALRDYQACSEVARRKKR